MWKKIIELKIYKLYNFHLPSLNSEWIIPFITLAGIIEMLVLVLPRIIVDLSQL